MQSITQPCQNCHKPMHGGTYRAIHLCPHCSYANKGVKMSRRLTKQALVQETVAAAPAFEPAPVATPEPVAAAEPVAASAPVAEAAPAAIDVADVVLTTKTEHEHNVVAQVAEVQAENAVMVAITPDMISDGKFTGSKSETVQNALKQARQNALAELREEASRLGANLVEAVEVKSGLKLADKQNAKVSVKATGQAVQAELAETAEA